jgi:Fic family protein
MIALINYQFEAIHPFLDGNGRVGRLLITALLVEWKILPGPLLDISAYIESHRDLYYNGLLRVSTQGDWAHWCEFFLEAVAYQAGDARSRLQRLRNLQESYRSRVASTRASGLLPRLINELFDAPVLTITQAVNLLGISHRAATVNIEKLIKLGIVNEVKY